MRETALLIRVELFGLGPTDLGEAVGLKKQDIHRLEHARRGYLVNPAIRDKFVSLASERGFEWDDAWFWDVEKLKHAIEKWGVKK